MIMLEFNSFPSRNHLTIGRGNPKLLQERTKFAAIFIKVVNLSEDTTYSSVRSGKIKRGGTPFTGKKGDPTAAVAL